MSHSENHKWLHRFALLTAAATLALIGIGGLVTSHEAGMSVPDWPTSYGYNMFLFPVSKWWHAGNVFYEHSHRLFASGVGLLTTILAVWLWFKERRTWLRWLGVIAFFAVVLQGVLGGLRVVWFKDQIGIFHALLAQLFFALTCAIALCTSRWWNHLERASAECRDPSPAAGRARTGSVARSWSTLVWLGTALIFLQLLLGATMRHQHAGLAIPDFPLAYGKLWPATDPQSIRSYNLRRPEIVALNPITAFQIDLQMIHRGMAVLIVALVSFCAFRSSSAARDTALQQPNPGRVLRTLAYLWLGLVVTQASLGAATVWSNKAADVATAHVLCGALLLAVGIIMCIISSCSPEFKRNTRALHSETACAPAGSLVSGR